MKNENKVRKEVKVKKVKNMKTRKSCFGISMKSSREQNWLTRNSIFTFDKYLTKVMKRKKRTFD